MRRWVHHLGRADPNITHRIIGPATLFNTPRFEECYLFECWSVFCWTKSKPTLWLGSVVVRGEPELAVGVWGDDARPARSTVRQTGYRGQHVRASHPSLTSSLQVPTSRRCFASLVGGRRPHRPRGVLAHARLMSRTVGRSGQTSTS